MPTYDCPVCGSVMIEFDTAMIMVSHPAAYHRCTACGLVATLDTPWLAEAYSTAIHTSDQGLLRRARRNSAFVSAIIGFEGLRGGRFLDWAGGYGVFTRFMRDRGIDYYHHDDFADPLFARDFQDDGTGRYDLITAFEVLEHLARPRDELAHLVERTDRLLFTTETLPDPTPAVADWWYYMPTVGQHITFHTVASLRLLGEQLGFELTSNGANWHLFHRGRIDPRTRVALSPWVIRAGRGARRVRAKLAGR